jgi:hypothetical protein
LDATRAARGSEVTQRSCTLPGWFPNRPGCPARTTGLTRRTKGWRQPRLPAMVSPVGRNWQHPPAIRTHVTRVPLYSACEFAWSPSPTPDTHWKRSLPSRRDPVRPHPERLPARRQRWRETCQQPLQESLLHAVSPAACAVIPGLMVRGYVRGGERVEDGSQHLAHSVVFCGIGSAIRKRNGCSALLANWWRSPGGM